MKRNSHALLFTFITICSSPIFFNNLSGMIFEMDEQLEITYKPIFLAAKQGNIEQIQLAVKNGFDPNFVAEDTQCTALGIACSSLNIAIMIANHYIAYLNHPWHGVSNNLINQLNEYLKEIDRHKQVVDFLAGHTKLLVNDSDQANIETTLKLLTGYQEDRNLSRKLQQLLPSSKSEYSDYQQSPD